jgi:hypothetical protein
MQDRVNGTRTPTPKASPEADSKILLTPLAVKLGTARSRIQGVSRKPSGQFLKVFARFWKKKA